MISTQIPAKKKRENCNGCESSSSVSLLLYLIPWSQESLGSTLGSSRWDLGIPPRNFRNGGKELTLRDKQHSPDPEISLENREWDTKKVDQTEIPSGVEQGFKEKLEIILDTKEKPLAPRQ